MTHAGMMDLDQELIEAELVRQLALDDQGVG